MPDLTPAQRKFISKYLQVVPKPRVYRSPDARVLKERMNEATERDYLAYEARKADADALLEEIGAEIAVSRSAIGALEAGGNSDEVDAFLTTFNQLTRSFDALGNEVAGKHVEVINAPADAPIFIEGARAMAAFCVNLISLKGRLPEVPDLLEDGALGAIIAAKREVGRMKAFEDISGLTPELVRIEIDDDAQEQRRENALSTHNELCDMAIEMLDETLADAKKTAGRKAADVLLEEVETTMAVLRNHRKGPVASLLKAVLASAGQQMDKLVADNNPVALREKDRAEEITASVSTLEDKAKKLKTKIDGLLDKLKAATSASEKKSLRAEIKDAQAQMGKLTGYKDQLKAYQDQMAARVGRIEKAEQQARTAATLLADPGDYFDTLPSEIPEMGVSDENAALMLLGDPDNEKAKGVYQFLRDQVVKASQRVSVDMKLFPGEPDLTDITKDQLDQLIALLELGKSFTEGPDKEYKKANHIFNEARHLFSVFNASNKFPLPEPAPAPVAADQAIEKEIKALTVALDRFWGRGGDGDDALRDALKAIVAARDSGAAAVPENFSAANALIEQFKKDLSAAIKAFRPGPQDAAAKQAAEDEKNNLLIGMLDLYKTKPVQNAKIGDVPEDKLLVITRDGKTEYHKIITSREGTQDERANSDVPLEAMNRVFEQAYMLEVLAQSDAPGVGERIEEAVADSKALLKAISEGGPHYKYILDKIKDVEKDMQQQIFIQWAPVGLGTLKADFDAFKSSYIEKMLPLDAKAAIDAIFNRIKPLADEAKALSVKYDSVDAVISGIENELTSDSGASDLSLGKYMADLIKAGPEKLLDGVTVAPPDMAEAEALLERMKDNLKTMSDLGSKVELKNDFAARLANARQMLDSKTDSGMDSAKALAETVRDEMVVARAQIEPRNDMSFLRELDSFLTGAAKGAKEAQAQIDKADALKAEIKAKLKEVEKNLKAKQGTLGSYAEYKEVFDSIKSQYDVANKAYKGTKNAELALQQFKPVKEDLLKLEAELNNQTEKSDIDTEAIDFKAARKALIENIGKVQSAADSVAGRLESKAADDDDEIKDAAEEVAGVLRLALNSKVASIFKLDKSLISDTTSMLAEADLAKKKDALNKLREKALAEVRRARNTADAHSALKIYRDNPIDRGNSWPQLASTLHGLEVDITKRLKP